MFQKWRLRRDGKGAKLKVQQDLLPGTVSNTESRMGDSNSTGWKMQFRYRFGLYGGRNFESG